MYTHCKWGVLLISFLLENGQNLLILWGETEGKYSSHRQKCCRIAENLFLQIDKNVSEDISHEGRLSVNLKLHDLPLPWFQRGELAEC